jgi:hypothetical protein
MQVHGHSGNMFGQAYEIVTMIHEANFVAMIMGFSCIFVLIVFKKLGAKYPN